jgi:hypothetical protein
MLGPVIGGPLYDGLGYFWSFVAFAALLGASMVIAMIITPNALNNSTEEDTNTEAMEEIEK